MQPVARRTATKSRPSGEAYAKFILFQLETIGARDLEGFPVDLDDADQKELDSYSDKLRFSE